MKPVTGKFAPGNIKPLALLALALLAFGLCPGCMNLNRPLPADWPIRMDLLPADAKVKVAQSSQEDPEFYERAGVSKQEASVMESETTHSWILVFTSKLSEPECRADIEQRLKEDKFRWMEVDAPDDPELTTDKLKYYVSPDGQHFLTVNWMQKRRVYHVTLMQMVQPNLDTYREAAPIE